MHSINISDYFKYIILSFDINICNDRTWLFLKTDLF